MKYSFQYLYLTGDQDCCDLETVDLDPEAAPAKDGWHGESFEDTDIFSGSSQGQLKLTGTDTVVNGIVCCCTIMLPTRRQDSA